MAETSTELEGGALIDKWSRLLSILSVSLFLSLVLMVFNCTGASLRPGIADRYALEPVLPRVTRLGNMKL